MKDLNTFFALCPSSYDGQSDLATFYTQSDSGTLDLKSYRAWIGLYRQWPPTLFDNGWRWNNGKNLDLYHWTFYAPNYGDKCGYVNYTNNNEMIGSADCQKYYFFICDKSDFNPESKTWFDAKDACQEKQSFLENYNNQGDLKKNVDKEDFPVWIGLYREGETWKWSAGVSHYTNWASAKSMTSGDCVTISSDNKQMATQNCANRFPFICHEDNVVLVKENKTWEEALEYCRALSSPPQPELRYELVSVQPEDYDYLRGRVMEADTEEVGS